MPLLLSLFAVLLLVDNEMLPYCPSPPNLCCGSTALSKREHLTRRSCSVSIFFILKKNKKEKEGTRIRDSTVSSPEILAYPAEPPSPYIHFPQMPTWRGSNQQCCIIR